MFAINGCFNHETENSLWSIRLCDCIEPLRVGGEHFVLKVLVFKARPAAAVRERGCR